MEDKPVPDNKDDCDFCQFGTRKLHYVAQPIATRNKRDGWLCTICWSTFAGNAFQYPEQYPEKESMRMIAFVGNTILKALGKEQ